MKPRCAFKSTLLMEPRSMVPEIQEMKGGDQGEVEAASRAPEEDTSGKKCSEHTALTVSVESGCSSLSYAELRAHISGGCYHYPIFQRRKLRFQRDVPLPMSMAGQRHPDWTQVFVIPELQFVSRITPVYWTPVLTSTVAVPSLSSNTNFYLSWSWIPAQSWAFVSPIFSPLTLCPDGPSLSSDLTSGLRSYL